MNLDLHIHSTASDGLVSPARVVRAAVDGVIDVMALTDHDTVAGVQPALDAARGLPIHIVPGIEVSATWDETEVHILGYLVDPTDPGLRAHDGTAGERRAQRLEEMVDRLAKQGVHVSFDAVVEKAGDEASSLGRPHLARVLQDEGFVATEAEAFDRFIGNEHPAYIPNRLLDPEAAIRMIHRAGGVAVWAHPPMYLLDRILPDLVQVGLDGLEVFRPRNGPEWMSRLEAAAREAGLSVLTGGSDWHGPQDGSLGDFVVSSRDVPRFLERAGM